MSAADPHWTAYVSAVGTPIVAMVAAGIAALIAYRQWKTARDRLKLDLFDRRFAIYKASMEFLSSIVTSGHVDEKEMFKFGVSVRDAKWLLNEEIAQYLDRDLRNRAIDLQVLEAEIKGLPIGADRAENVRRQGEIKKWIRAQYEVIDARFAPFLRLSH